tara:strand:- start:119 stop:331 length:213 start_codon:yes stop_codon:yes gene_type:complete
MNTTNYVSIQVNTIIKQALENTCEKIAIKLLKNTSFKDILKKKQYHLIFDTGFMTEHSSYLVYPSYFQHG